MRYNHEEQGDDIEGDILLIVTTLNEEDREQGLPEVYLLSCLGCALETIQELYNKLGPEFTLDIQLVALKTDAPRSKENADEQMH